MYIVKQVVNKQEWESFVLRQEYTLTTQSWNFGEFYKSMGEQCWILGVYRHDELIGGALVVSVHAKRGKFLFVPYGPIVQIDDAEIFNVLFSRIEEIGRKEKFVCIRISPFIDNLRDAKEIFKKNGYREAPLHILAENTWLLDLKDEEKTILANMNKNHRNLIKRCEREGVHVQSFNSKDKLKEFHQMINFTARRHNFVRFSDDYVEKEFNAFTSDDEVLVYHAYLPDGRLDSAAVVYFYGNTAAYRHGTSLIQDKKLPTSYLIQWNAILEAKRRGLKWYNFWGIAPDSASKNHPFHGITHFKKGFGGKQKDLLPCYDKPLSHKYWFTWAIDTVRKIKRGF